MGNACTCLEEKWVGKVVTKETLAIHEVVSVNGFDGVVALGPTTDHEVPKRQSGSVDSLEEVVGFEDVCGGKCVGFEKLVNGGRGRVHVKRFHVWIQWQSAGNRFDDSHLS
ncbi:NAD-dependent succinate-semialdehyde dehydrogenase [Sesbania bispinosa]|nr:NAD-dependent succinate-semialdehyde dehydrogenase [Sesbania bispinosa]